MTLRLPVYLAASPPAAMRVVAPLRVSARGPGAHLDALLAELDRQAAALRADAVAVRAIRVGGEATVTVVPRPCPGELPALTGPPPRCAESFTGTELEMTLEADALRAGAAGWPTPRSGDGGAAE